MAPGFQTFVSCQQQLVPKVQPPPLQPQPFFFFSFALLHFMFVLKSSPASAHYLCVAEPGAKSDLILTLCGKCAVKVLNKQPVNLGTKNETEES